MYDELNDDAKEYFLLLLSEKVKDENMLKRCMREINVLYEKNILFVIEYLHRYKEYNKQINYHFKGAINNLLLLYILGLSKVDPIKYNLPYELYTGKSLDIYFINGYYLEFIDYIERNMNIWIAKGSFEPCDIDEINKSIDNHYLLIPRYASPSNMTFRINEDGVLETAEDYHYFKDEYMVVRLDNKNLIQEPVADIKHALHSDFERELADKLKLGTTDDYIKVISLGYSTNLWKDNQDKLYKDGLIDIKTIISNREDVYEYLIDHSINADTSIEIVKQLTKLRTNESNKLWQYYISVMKEHQCDDMFINILSKSLFIATRGEAISECLYALDEANYYWED